jgi:putative addiction module component (TIGR02574 family)
MRRLELIGRLWASKEQDALPLSDAQLHELDRQLATLGEEGPEGLSWEQVRAELERSCL